MHFGVAHDFGLLWKMRGLLTSSGKPIQHHTLVADLFEAILLPSQLANVPLTLLNLILSHMEMSKLPFTLPPWFINVPPHVQLVYLPLMMLWKCKTTLMMGSKNFGCVMIVQVAFHLQVSNRLTDSRQQTDNKTVRGADSSISGAWFCTNQISGQGVFVSWVERSAQGAAGNQDGP